MFFCSIKRKLQGMVFFEKNIVTRVLYGKEIAQDLLQWCQEKSTEFYRHCGERISLGVLQIGENPASCVYVHHKKKTAETLGFHFHHCLLPENTDPLGVKKNLKKLCEECHGVIVQLPLPSVHFDKTPEYLCCIPPEKDVDGLTKASLFSPCTPLGCVLLLLAYGYDLEGQNVTIVGRSNLVGKPLGQLLLDHNASVCFTHSKTKDLKPFFDLSSIVCVAAGVEGLIGPSIINENLTILDIGIHRGEDGKLRGDVHSSVYPLVKAYTPVPGGIGPMTVACLMANTIKAAFFGKNLCFHDDLFSWAKNLKK